MVTIPAQYSKACITIEAYDDEILEGNEMFYITANASNLLDEVIGNSSVVVSDNDGMYSSNYYVSITNYVYWYKHRC